MAIIPKSNLFILEGIKMTKTAIVSSPKYLLHKTGPHHPETPSRLRVISRELNKSGILTNKKCTLLNPDPINLNELKLVHKTDYINQIKRFCRTGGGLLDHEDTVASPESYEVALLAAGGTTKAANLVMSGKYKNAFAFVRPPGHHAGTDYAMGFCIFNNVAVAASNLIEKFDLKRVLILDIDAHHGNGTQEIFYKNNKVLYVSLHEDPIDFPLKGFANELGKEEGLGFTVNIPLPYETDDKIYLRAFNEIVTPIIKQYKPQFILVSTGFDNHYSDPVGNLRLSSRSYLKIFDKLLELASQSCQGKLVAVLEGGYSLRFLGKMTSAVTARLAGISYSFKDKPHVGTFKIRKKGEAIINQVKKLQSSFWNMG